jgi:hypothetical protein
MSVNKARQSGKAPEKTQVWIIYGSFYEHSKRGRLDMLCGKVILRRSGACLSDSFTRFGYAITGWRLGPGAKIGGVTRYEPDDR